MNRQACAVVLTRGHDQDREVYLTLRSSKLAFMGGFHAFPGGTMAKVDSRVPVANATPELPANFVSCAARELFEECGVVLSGQLVVSPDKDAIRTQLLADDNLWEALVSRGDIVLDARAFRPFGRWVTPPFSPMRFDALYLQIDADAYTPVIWPGELDEGAWMTPQSAIDAHDAGDILLSYPVLETLRSFIRHSGNVEATARECEERDPFPSGGEMLAGLQAIPLRTPTLPPATHTNVYVLGGKELVVVDPAPVDTDEQAALLKHLDRAVAEGARITEVWLTHHHPDHIGSATLVRDRYGARIAAHTLTAPDLPFAIDRTIDDGETTVMTLNSGHQAEWTAVFTPGHARGHLCFFERRRRTLLSGDLIASIGTIIVAPPDGDMRDYMASLQRVRDLDARLLFPAHGPPVDANRKIDEYIAHRIAREKAILQALPGTPQEIVPRVYTDVAPHVFPLAEINVRSHLAKLVADGRVRESGQDQFTSS